MSYPRCGCAMHETVGEAVDKPADRPLDRPHGAQAARMGSTLVSPSPSAVQRPCTTGLVTGARMLRVGPSTA